MILLQWFYKYTNNYMLKDMYVIHYYTLYGIISAHKFKAGTDNPPKSLENSTLSFMCKIINY